MATAHLRGIPAVNAPFSNTRSVAELVLAEIIMLSPGIPSRNTMADRGLGEDGQGILRIRSKCLGVVGYDHIET